MFGKGGKTRSIAIPAPLIEDLYRFRAGAGAEVQVFSSRSGKPLDRGRVRIILRSAAEKAGVESVNQPPLAAPRARQPRAGPRGADSPGASYPRAQFGGDDERLAPVRK